ncbi:hypothetical protein P43SY_006182 [Pythium insidiosum]|uniref:Uncharacterized protein n=1 Tax=Pythium insidiosum TaxID=114742 RepID=A0AAD5LHM8_PYTIN|nr:hypothetical protein P43SY_006182 [Pythium insidiosum]
MTSMSTPPPLLAPSVLLAFDDFSLAGSHLLRHASVAGGRGEPQELSAKSGVSATLAERIRVCHYRLQPDSARAELSTVVVESAALLQRDGGVDGAALWELADAVASLLSAADVRELTVVASLHLPDAKPRPAPLDNVYFARVVAAAAVDAAAPSLFDGSAFATLDAQWELKDALLARLLHLLRVDHSVATAVLLAKGFRPGRDGAGTRDALATLELALQRYTRGLVAFDRQAASRDAALTQRARPPQHSPELALLYQ